MEARTDIAKRAAIARVDDALARARAFLSLVRGEDDCELEKSLWGSPAGKRHLAKRIVAAIPRHRVYVEPFAGGAQVFWAKEPSEVEVLADRDPDIAFAFRFVKGLTPKKLERLKRKSWVGDAERFRKLYESNPEDEVDRFYRFAYLAHFSFNKLRRGTMPDKHVGVEARFIERLEKFAPRLKDVVVRCADYEDVVDEFDATDTFFFLDPPYPGYEAEVGHDDWDERRFAKVLRRIDGRFLVTYGTRSDGAAELFKVFHVERWRHTSGVGAHQGQGLRKSVTLIATNYRLKKSEEPEDHQMLLPNIATPAAAPIEKTIWGSPAGKKRLAARLTKLIPPHRVYVEPFAGSAAVFFEKEPAEVEVLGDADPEIAAAFKALKTLTDEELDALRKKDWVGRASTFKALQDARPRGKVEKLYRFLYLSHFAYGKLRGKSYNPNAEGVEARTVDRIEQHRDRLRAAKIRHADYAELVKEFDGKDTFFFLDPPYPGHDVEVGEDTFDEVEFRKVLDGIKGRFLVTYGTRGQLDTSGFHVRKIRPPRSIRTMRGVGGPKTLPQLLISNYAITEKAVGGGWALDEVLDVIDVEGPRDGSMPERVATRLAELTSAVEVEVTLFDPNQPRDESGRFAETGAGDLPASSAAKERISRASEAVRDVPVKDVRERYSRLQRGREPVHNERLVEAHERFTSGWRHRTDDVNGLAGKVLAGTATDAELASFRERVGPHAEDYLAERYALTQRLLRDKGVREVTLYRGVRGEQARAIREALESGAEHIDLDTRSISSFSESRKAAAEFGDVVIKVTVPVERVFAHHAVERHFAKGGESEVVLWNPEGKLRVDRRSVRLKTMARAVPSIPIDDEENGNWLRLWSGELRREELHKLAIADIHPDRLRDVPDAELLSVHRRLHQLFGGSFSGNDRLSAGGLRREDLVNAELFVQDEMARRGLRHEADDELAHETAALRRTAKQELAPVHPSGEALGPEITLGEVLPHFRSFKLRAPFLYLVGGLANNGRTRNDIDVLVRGRLPEELRKAIEFRLGRMLPPEISGRLQLLDDDYAGPFTSHVELADLVVEVRPTLDVKRMRLAHKQDDPLLDLPKERGPRPGVLQYHFRGRSVHGDLRLQVDDYLVGWTLSLQRPGAIARPVDSVEEARRIARSFSVEGDRYAKPLLAPDKVFAAPKARQPVVWLTIDGEVFGEGEVGATRNEKGVMVAVDHPKVEFGLQKPFAHEYFFTGGRELNGVMHFRLLTGQGGEPTEEIEAGRRSPEGEPFWTAFLSKELLPSVLKPRAVETRTMPPDGYSAIPVSLERVTPKEHRYWEAKGDEAREMRDALVESGFFTAENIKLVDGEFRRVVQKLFLFTPPPGTDSVEKARVVPFQQWGGSSKYARRLADRLPEHTRYVEPFCGAAAVFFAKEPAREEVLADANPDVVCALRYIQKLTPKTMAALERFPWKVSRAGFERVRETEPKSDAERVWKLIYGRLCTWGAKPNLTGYATIHDGQIYDLEDLWRFHERLQGVRLVTQDWKKTLAECDGPGTLFFLDPPYADEWAVGDGIEPEEIASAVARLEGDYIIAYTDSARARRALEKVGRPFKLRIPEGRGAGQWQKRSRLFVASCRLRKSDGVEWVDGALAEIEKQPREVDFTLSWQFWKGQTVVRAAPSRQVWHLILDRAGAGLDTWVLQADPLSGEERMTALYAKRHGKDLLTFDGEVPPGEKIGGDVLNDTKATPSTIRIQDQGRAELLDDQPAFKTLRFEGERLRGVFTLTAEEAGGAIWQLARGRDPGRAVPETKAAVPVRDGVQIWDPARKDPDVDRTALRPLAIFQPMKPAPRATNEFRQVDAAVAWATPEMLAAGVAVEPKFNGFRVVLEKAGPRVLVFTEDTKRDISPALPRVTAELAAVPGEFILDGEFFDFNEAGDPVPRRELGEFRADEPRDDSRAQVQVFDILYRDGHNFTATPYQARREQLDRFFDGRRFRHLRKVDAVVAHDAAALRRAIDQVSKVPGSEGAMLKLASSTYSLGGENDAWAKLKLVREVRAIVYERHPVKDAPGVFNFSAAIGPIPRAEASRWKETVEVGGKLYTPVGKTFNARLDAKPGDVIRVEVTELLVDRSGPAQSVTWFTPVVIDRTGEPPMTPHEVMRLAQPEEVKKLLAAALSKRLPLLKTGEERYVLGIVLEPETVDAQRDIYSAAEVREAAHRFMEEYRNLGLMHREILGDQVKILESYLAPVEFELDGTRVRKGTWMLAVRVLDDALWKQVKAGELTGFSIGGSAVRSAPARSIS